MKLTVISDTHGDQEQLGRLSGDVLIHCGDMFNLFEQRDDDFERMDAWFGEQDFDLILCTGGNHDFELEKRAKDVLNPFKNAIYLEDQSYEYGGLRFFGSPWVPDLYGHAFYADSDELEERWAAIPGDTDVLITHTPPAGILDVSSRGLVLGCRHLFDAVSRISPKVHCFGHVHASSGTRHYGDTRYVNAALVNSRYQIKRVPFEMELDL